MVLVSRGRERETERKNGRTDIEEERMRRREQIEQANYRTENAYCERTENDGVQEQ